MADDAMLEMLKETRADLKEIKDNHLPHMEASIKEIKADVDSLVSLRDDIMDYMKKNLDKALMVVVAGFGAAIGVPLALN